MAKRKSANVTIVTQRAPKRSRRSYRRSYRDKKKLTDSFYQLSAQPEDNPLRQMRRQMFGPSKKWGQAGDQTWDQTAMRRATGYYGPGAYHGHGGYWDDIKKGGWFGKNEMIGSGLRNVGRGAAGLVPYLGGFLGDAGEEAGAGLSKWMGFGAYGGDAGGNQIMAGSAETPMMVNTEPGNLEGDVYFTHREYIGNVNVTGTTPAGTGNTTVTSPFTNISFPVNVGLSGTFPWLSQVSNQFTLYQLLGCVFEYRPLSGEFGQLNNTLGKVIMATQYDPDAAAFTSTQQMENYDYVNSCKPSEHMMHGIETANQQKATNMLYTRNGPSPKDKIFTDYGLFQIATQVYRLRR